MKHTIAKALVAGVAAIAGIVGIAASTGPVLAASFAQSQDASTTVNVAWAGNLSSTTSTSEAPLLAAFRNAINWVLGLLGFIALCILLWGGFQMVTAAGDEKKYGSGMTILKQAGMGLLFIGLSALFVNAIMFIITKFAG
jgi:Type IV secretion system pilin